MKKHPHFCFKGVIPVNTETFQIWKEGRMDAELRGGARHRRSCCRMAAAVRPVGRVWAGDVWKLWSMKGCVARACPGGGGLRPALGPGAGLRQRHHQLAPGTTEENAHKPPATLSLCSPAMSTTGPTFLLLTLATTKPRAALPGAPLQASVGSGSQVTNCVTLGD